MGDPPSAVADDVAAVQSSPGGGPMTRHRKAAADHLRTDVWTEERREQARRAWAERNPERAGVRDEILASEPPSPCTCGATDVVLLVTDYATRDHVWRCRACVKAGRS